MHLQTILKGATELLAVAPNTNNKRSIAVTSRGCNRLDVFAVATNNAIQHLYLTDHDNNGWETIGGYATSPPVAVSAQYNQLDVIYRGRNFSAFLFSYDGSTWSPSNLFGQSLGGNFTSSLSAVSWGSGRVDVFGKGPDDAFYWLSYNSGSFGWDSTWVSLSGRFISEPVAYSWGPNRIDVFGVGTNNVLYQKTYDGVSWSPAWINLGGSCGGPPTVCSRGVGLLDVVVLGGGNDLYHKAYANGAWAANFEAYGGVFTTSVSCATSNYFGTTRLDWVGLGGGPVIYHKAWMSSTGYDPGVTDWTRHYGRLSPKPEIVSSGANRLDIFGIRTDGGMTHQAWNGTGWAPAIDAGEDLGGSFMGFNCTNYLC